MKNEDKIMGTVLVFVFCVIVVIIIMQQREIPQVRHAMEASYGEYPSRRGMGYETQRALLGLDTAPDQVQGGGE
jgi:hypothetical protein